MNHVIDLLTIQTIGLTVAAISVVIGVINSILMNRHTQRTRDREVETRQAQLFMQLYSLYDTRDFLEDYGNVAYIFEYKDLDDWMKKYHPKTNIAAYSSWIRVGRFFDGAGILVKKNLIDINLIIEQMREVILYSWEKMEPWVIESRTLMKHPQLWENFEYLASEVRKRYPEWPHGSALLRTMKEWEKKRTVVSSNKHT